MASELIPTTKIAVFRKKEIRKTIHNNEWWFVVEDVVIALTDSVNPKDYINKMRRRDEELAKGYGQFVHTLPVETRGGNVAGIARRKLEQEIQRKVISRENYLQKPQSKKLKGG